MQFTLLNLQVTSELSTVRREGATCSRCYIIQDCRTEYGRREPTKEPLRGSDKGCYEESEDVYGGLDS